MANTSGDALYYPTGTSGLQLIADLANMQNTNQTAFNRRAIYSYRWANNAARTAQTGMRAGDQGYQVDSGIRWTYDGANWTPANGDSGWVDMFASGLTGYTASTGGNVAYRRLNDVVYLRGRVSRTGGSNNMFQLPGGFRPGNAVNIWQSVGGGGATQRLQVANTGVISWIDGGTFSDMSLAMVSFIAEA